MKRQRGFSLLELMVALISSSLLLMVLTHQYVGVKRHYLSMEKTLESSLDLQLVTDLIRDSARKAGFTPCLRIDNLASVDTRDGKQPLLSIEMSNSGFKSNHMSDYFGLVMKQVSSTYLIITRDTPVSSKKPVLIADCYHAEVHNVRSIQPGQENVEISLEQPLQYNYVPPIYIGEWLEERFYVHQGQSTLYYQLNHHADALSRAVKALNVLLTTHHGKQLLQVTLSLENAKPIQLDTVIRGTQ